VNDFAAAVGRACAEAPKVLGLIGEPLHHSLSPAMHDAAYRALGVDARYAALPTSDLPAALEVLRAAERIAGFAVTHPFKTRILPHLDVVDPTALAIGAVNTVVKRGDTLHGFNTDWLGALAGLRALGTRRGDHCVVMGAGGAARAIAHAVVSVGGRLTIVSRSRASGEALAHQLGTEYVPLAEIARLHADFLVNATPVGAPPYADVSLVRPACLRQFACALDVVYNPVETRLLREARACGLRTESGLAMVVVQGAEQIRLWFEREPDVALMRSVMLDQLGRQPSSRRAEK
jgi:shikimate dehydrogenase